MFDVSLIRRDFPVLEKKVHGKQLVYFDNAATTQKPIQVIEAVGQFYRTIYANVGRSVHELGLRATEAYEEARKIVSAFIGARPDELVFTKHATESINLAAYSLLASGMISRWDLIVTTRMEHHSNCLLYTSPSPRDRQKSRMPSSA